MIKLTPQKPPYYENVARIPKVLTAETTYQNVPNGTEVKFLEYNIPKNTMKNGHAVQAIIWLKTTGAGGIPKIYLAGILIDAPDVGGAGTHKLEFTIWYKGTTTGSLTRVGMLYAAGSYTAIADVDWTIDNLVELKVQATATGVDFIAATLENIIPTT